MGTIKSELWPPLPALSFLFRRRKGFRILACGCLAVGTDREWIETGKIGRPHKKERESGDIEEKE